MKFADETLPRVNEDAPGEYWLRTVVNDSSGGNQCSWTTAHVALRVT